MPSAAGILALSVGFAVSSALPALAQNNTYHAGQAAGGQSIVVNLDSIYSVGRDDARFVYSFAGESIPSQAHCAGSSAWTTLDDGVLRYPQSQATRNMLSVVCSYSAAENDSLSQVALVYAPPSNVRATANGRVLCSISGRSYINIYSYSAGWYETDACGQVGVIHESQVQF